MQEMVRVYSHSLVSRAPSGATTSSKSSLCAPNPHRPTGPPPPFPKTPPPSPPPRRVVLNGASIRNLPLLTPPTESSIATHEKARPAVRAHSIGYLPPIAEEWAPYFDSAYGASPETPEPEDGPDTCTDRGEDHDRSSDSGDV